MVNVEQLLAALRRPGPRPAVPLCACGAVADDRDGTAICTACLLRRAHLAARPDVFEAQVLAAAAEEHGDVVRIGTEAIEAHMHVTQIGLIVHETHRLAWQWTPEWPTDDRTLEDILETRSLERLWGAA